MHAYVVKMASVQSELLLLFLSLIGWRMKTILFERDLVLSWWESLLSVLLKKHEPIRMRSYTGAHLLKDACVDLCNYVELEKNIYAGNMAYSNHIKSREFSVTVGKHKNPNLMLVLSPIKPWFLHSFIP